MNTDTVTWEAINIEANIKQMLDKDEWINERESFFETVGECAYNLDNAKQVVEKLANDLGKFRQQFLNKTIGTGSK